MILFLHNRYRTTGGEERALEDLLWLARERLGEQAELLTRDSATLGRARAAVALLAGGLAPDDVGAAVRRTRARVVHAHNVNPAFGWRALAAARAAGARVVLHLHNYRLVCAVATCFTQGADCTRCHGANTLPGVRLRCRGSLPEAAVYGLALSLWQRRLVEQADVVVVPSAFARRRLGELGAPLGMARGQAAPGAAHRPPVVVVPHVMREFTAASAAAGGQHALVASRLATEKGVELAIEACRGAGVPLVIAGDGPLAGELRAHAADAEVRFVGRVDGERLAALRAEAALAIVPSRSAETFGLAAAEAMAAGVPVVATRVGALPELVDDTGLVEPGDVAALTRAIKTRYGDAAAGQYGIARVRALCAPEVVAERLAKVYERAGVGRG